MLRLAEGAWGAGNDKGADRAVSAWVTHIKLDAGTRNLRCQYITVAS